MTGRGIDQILASPVDPTIHEQWARSAIDYVDLCEKRSGPIPTPVGAAYVWGDVKVALDDRMVDARVINLETAVTERGEPWPGKGIHYRMSPANLDALTAAGIDVCCLANNHVLDWSYAGLEETLASLAGAGLAVCGAGLDRDRAWRPVTLHLNGCDVSVLSVGMTSSGIPPEWEAGIDAPGVAIIPPEPSSTVELIARSTAGLDENDGLLIVSIHWGPNWGYEIPSHQREIARHLIDQAAVDVVFGHSSHHPTGIEVHNGRPILYGCGDLVNDYEGIVGHDRFRPDLRVAYFLDFDPHTKCLRELELVPFVTKQFRLEWASGEDTDWLAARLTEESQRLGTRFEVTGDRSLLAIW